MQGLMQDWPLTLDRIIQHAAKWHGEREVVSRRPDGSRDRTCYAEVEAAARRFSSALLSLGIGPGDRIATMAMNSGRHLECWYGIMGIGAVCHTLNPRLFDARPGIYRQSRRAMSSLSSIGRSPLSSPGSCQRALPFATSS